MNYLELVNKVIQESGSEIDELTSVTWDQAVAGRRQYPRIKRYVADAWKMIQIGRDEWHFKATEFSTMLKPRVRFHEGSTASTPPAVGEVFVGDQSGYSITVSSLILESGTFAGGDAIGQIEFVTSSGDTSPIIGEYFFSETEPSEFIFIGGGAYSTALNTSDLSNIKWDTLVMVDGEGAVNNLQYIPWDRWQDHVFSESLVNQDTSYYVTLDPMGRLMFNPQPAPFRRIIFMYNKTPQDLEEYDDIPDRMPAHFHEWIAWEALCTLATYDKNPQLFNHAKRFANLYRSRVDKHELPAMCWAENPFNYL